MWGERAVRILFINFRPPSRLEVLRPQCQNRLGLKIYTQGMYFNQTYETANGCPRKLYDIALCMEVEDAIVSS